jgi:hypothetical protein
MPLKMIIPIKPITNEIQIGKRVKEIIEYPKPKRRKPLINRE